MLNWKGSISNRVCRKRTAAQAESTAAREAKEGGQKEEDVVQSQHRGGQLLDMRDACLKSWAAEIGQAKSGLRKVKRACENHKRSGMMLFAKRALSGESLTLLRVAVSIPLIIKVFTQCMLPRSKATLAP